MRSNHYQATLLLFILIFDSCTFKMVKKVLNKSNFFALTESRSCLTEVRICANQDCSLMDFKGKNLKKLLIIVIIFNDFVSLKSSNNYSPTNSKQILWS